VDVGGKVVIQFNATATTSGAKEWTTTAFLNQNYTQPFTLQGTQPTVAVDSAPTATVALNTSTPRTNDTLTATATKADADGDAVTLTYVWKVNGTPKKTTAGSSSLSDTFDLSVAGNGDRGDTILVEVTPNDGTVDGAAASAMVTVVNSVPSAGTVAITPPSPTTNQTLTATPSGFSDADGDTLTYHYQWSKNGTAIAGATGSTLDLSVAGNG